MQNKSVLDKSGSSTGSGTQSNYWKILYSETVTVRARTQYLVFEELHLQGTIILGDDSQLVIFT